MSPWSCPEASYYECVTLTSLGKSLLHLFTLPTWHGCYEASHPSVAALGWVSALQSQMVEGLLGWLVGSLELVAQAGVVLLSWGSWLHGAALRFTNKQEARPLPPCCGWSPVLIAQLAQRGTGSPGFTRQLPGRGGGGILGPTARMSFPALRTYLFSWDSPTENQS